MFRAHAARAAMPGPIVAALAASALVALGCRGELGAPAIYDRASESPGRPGDSPEPPNTSPDEPDEGSARRSEAPLRRLTRAEYQRSAQDLLGIKAPEALDFPNDGVAGPFPSNAESPVAHAHVDRYRKAAEALAERVDPWSLVPCSPQGADRACRDAFVRDFGRRAYRRPLADKERDALDALFEVGQQEAGFEGGIRLTVAAALQSPRFLYHVEGANHDGQRPLDDYELASRLSYALWRTMPDDELFEAAAEGELSEAEGLRAQAERLLGDERAGEAIEIFAEAWLGIGGLGQAPRSSKVFPDLFDEAFAKGARVESQRFVRHVLFEDDARLETLLSADYSFPSPALAPLYGLEPSEIDATKPTPLPEERRGVLTHPSVLAQYSATESTSPIKRGVFLMHNVLCIDVEVPPGLEIPTLPDPKPGETSRDRFALHTANAACAACHEVIDPLGFALEGFDPIGAHRQTDQGMPVDDSATIQTGDPALDGELRGGAELARRFGRSEQAHKCMARQLFRWTMGRSEKSADRAQLAELEAHFIAQGGDLIDLILLLITSDSFRTLAGRPQ